MMFVKWLPLSVVGLCIWLLIQPGACLQGEAQEPPLSAQARAKNLESFDFVWTTIRDKHWDPKLGGLDWDKVREELRPKMAEVQSMSEARAILKDMIARLKLSHFGIMAQEELESLDHSSSSKGQANDASGGDGDVGLEFRILEGKAIVTRVEKNLPADRQGVKMGWEIVSIDGDAIAPLIERIGKSKRISHLGYIQYRVVANRLEGSVGSKANLVFHNGSDEEVKVELERVAPRGKKAQFGHMPTIHVRFEAKVLEPNVVYASLNTFFDPLSVMPQLEKLIKENQGAKGFILDLRGNPGGIGFMAVGIGGWFAQKDDMKLGTMYTRDGTMHFILNPRTPSYQGPLAILVDAESASTSEILAGGLQDLGRARVFGTTTMGAALPSVITKLPNGDGFQYAFANYISFRGAALEGRGVIPDQEVKLDRATLLQGRDPVIEAALDWIKEQAKK